jgi:glycosyltransferase involved in cell wall biosynthesis
MNNSLVTVVVATLASREKSAALFRALTSIRDQNINCRIVAVVNGPKRDGDVVAALKQAADIDVLDLEDGNLVKALTAGVAAVQTEYFSVLDDDDVFTTGACRKRYEYMVEHPEADVLATSGTKQFSDGRTERIPARFDSNDPLASLFDCNWLPSCGGMYRRARIGADFFASMPRYLEWTYLAFRLARERRVHFWNRDAEPHFTIFETTGSESLGLNYVLALPRNIAQMHDSTLPPHIQRLLADKIARAFHDAAARCVSAGRTKDAWRFHLESVSRRSGIRYLPYTRHLLAATLQSVVSTRPAVTQ